MHFGVVSHFKPLMCHILYSVGLNDLPRANMYLRTFTMSGVESLGDADVRERLLPAGMHHTSQDESEERDTFTHEELLHSIGSFSAVVWPVTVTMLLARCVPKSFCTTNMINNAELTIKLYCNLFVVMYCSFVSLNVVDPASAKALAEYVATSSAGVGSRAANGLVVVSGCDLKGLLGLWARQGQGCVHRDKNGGCTGECSGDCVVFPRGDIRDCLLLQVQLQQGEV